MPRTTLPLVLFVVGSFPASALQVGALERVSVTISGAQLDGDSVGGDVSADGRIVVFQSDALNLWAKKLKYFDIGLRDRLRNETALVSLSTDGRVGNSHSTNAHITADGRFVSFDSRASNLVAGDSNGVSDVFVRDLAAASTRRVSVSSAGVPGDFDSLRSAISADGSTVVFASQATNLTTQPSVFLLHVYAHDLATGTTTLISHTPTGLHGNGSSGIESIGVSRNGEFVAFTSLASDLVPGDTNSKEDAFVHERSTGQVRRVSLTSAGLQTSAASFAGDLDAGGGAVTLWSAHALVPWDGNAHHDVYVRDAASGALDLISRNLIGLGGNQPSLHSRLSSDGRRVVFQSFASDLIAGDTNGVPDVFLRDLDADTTVRLSQTGAGVGGDLASFAPELAAGGSAALFSSDASNLVAGDTNSRSDVFLVDFSAPTLAYCPPKKSSIGCKPSIGSYGAPRASALEGFSVHATHVRNHSAGVLLYGTNGRVLAPFQCGMLCVRPPIHRTPTVASGGSPLPFVDCSGAFSIDLAAFSNGSLGGLPVPGLRTPGTTVNCQWWGPDPGYAAPCDKTLSNALEYTVVP